MKVFIFILIAIGFSACSHHKDVRADFSGEHNVTVQTDNPNKGQSEAIRQAKRFCNLRKEEVIFTQSKNEYIGNDTSKEYYKREGERKEADKEYTVKMKFRCI